MPLTSNLRCLKIPGTLAIPAGEGELTQESVALCYQITVIDRLRLIRELGKLSPLYVEQLNEALTYTLELEKSEEQPNS